MTKNDIDLKIIIKEDCEIPTSKYNGKYSKSTLFLLPMLGLNIRDKLINKYLKNTFINDEGIEHVFTNCLFLLFNVKNLREKDWQELSLNLKQDKYHRLDYYVGINENVHLVMFVMEIPERYISDYNSFLEGNYSKFTMEYKSKFPARISNTTGVSVESIVYGAIYKTDNLKNLICKEFNLERSFVNQLDEIWDKYKESEEIYRLKQNNE